MQEEVVRDNAGNRIGTIETLPDGTLVARDEHGDKVGEYDPKTDVTRDSARRKVGMGNHLLWLIAPETS
jgi:hypothetical protein